MMVIFVMVFLLNFDIEWVMKVCLMGVVNCVRIVGLVMVVMLGRLMCILVFVGLLKLL